MIITYTENASYRKQLKNKKHQLVDLYAK